MEFVYRLNAICVLTIAMLGSCQSSRLHVWFTPASAYHAVPATIPALNDTIVESTALSPLVLDQPVLVAAASTEKELEAPAINYTQTLPVAESFSRLADKSILPDTISTKQSTRPTPEQMREGDKFTRNINIVGVFFVALGVILIVAALTTTSPGWGALAALVYGVVALLISLPFLLFRSRKSTSYVLEQEARAARKASKGHK